MNYQVVEMNRGPFEIKNETGWGEGEGWGGNGHRGLTRSLPDQTSDRRRPQANEGCPVECQLWCTPDASHTNGREIGDEQTWKFLSFS